MGLVKKITCWTAAALNIMLSVMGFIAMLVGTVKGSSQLAGFGALAAMVNAIPTTVLVFWLTEER